MAAVVLDELIRSLSSLSSTKDKMTNQEAEVISQWRSQALRGLAVGGSISMGLTWIATRRLNSFNRVTLAGGAGFLTILWRLRNSIDSCVDRILGMDGSRMQHELTKIILEKYGNDPEKMQLFSKHFYCEEVFNDSTPRLPELIYRPRNLYVDDHQTSDGNTSQESVKKVYRHQRNDDSKVKLRSPGSEIKQVPINPGINVFGYGDPLDVLFGHSSPNEEPRLPNESGKSAKVQNHSQRRARRRHRLRHRHQESLPIGMAQFQGA